MSTKLSLWVYFKENSDRDTIRNKVEKLVGEHATGSGAAIGGLSDVSFNFDNRRRLSLAIGRVRRAMGKNTSFKVFNGRGIVHGNWEKKC
jgi:hypothetical protein